MGGINLSPPGIKIFCPYARLKTLAPIALFVLKVVESHCPALYVDENNAFLTSKIMFFHLVIFN